MQSSRRTLPLRLAIWLAFTAALSGCWHSPEAPFEVISENPAALCKTSSMAADLHGRMEALPTMDLSTYMNGVDSTKGPYWVRVSVTDKSGKVLEHDFGPEPAPFDTSLLDDELRSSAMFGDSTWNVTRRTGPYAAKRPLVWDLNLGLAPGAFVVQIPFNALPKAAPGTDVETYFLVEGFFGTHEAHDPLRGDLPKPIGKADRPDMRTVAVTRYKAPTLRKATFTVGKVEVDANGKTDPHDWDFGLFSARESRGYPDLIWQLMVDGKQAHESAVKMHNAMSGDFRSFPAEVWMANWEEEPKLMICFMDWDNENLMANRHDEIGCWEGELMHLSADGRKPTVLKCGDIQWAEVSVKVK